MALEHLYSNEVTELKYNNTKIVTNRYDTKVKLITADGEYTRMLKSNELIAVPSDNDTYVYVDITYQYDPFKLAYEYYNNENFYWVILAANGLSSMFELKEGITIRIPNIASIMGYNGLLVKGDEI